MKERRIIEDLERRRPEGLHRRRRFQQRHSGIVVVVVLEHDHARLDDGAKVPLVDVFLLLLPTLGGTVRDVRITGKRVVVGDVVTEIERVLRLLVRPEVVDAFLLGRPLDEVEIRFAILRAGLPQGLGIEAFDLVTGEIEGF